MTEHLSYKKTLHQSVNLTMSVMTVSQMQARKQDANNQGLSGEMRDIVEIALSDKERTEPS